jgi:8-oxo-dGTP pyrophosphatase MutT (NUDIX family)
MGLAVRVFVARHRAGVTLVCFDPDGRLLMLRHVFHPSTPWGLPGGWLEREESPADCALRELYEETGLRAELGPVVHLANESEPAHIGITYTARLISPKVDLALSGEILEAAWFFPDEMPERLLPATRQAIKAAVRQFPAMSATEQLVNV